MEKAFNEKSKIEDQKLYEATDMILEYAQNNVKLPGKFHFEKWDKLPFNLMDKWLENRGLPLSERQYLQFENKGGDFSSIKPDGGVIVAVEKDYSGNVIRWVPILSAEAKHQDSGVGNAIERVFKNYNAFKELFNTEDIFPYICFGQGPGLDTQYEKNKVRVGMGNDVNNEINIYDRPIPLKNGKHIVKKNGNFLVREEPWSIDEMYGRLLTAFLQSSDYFFGEKNRYE